MKLASNYPTRQQAVVDGGGLFVVVAASKRGAAAAERAAFADDRAKFARGGITADDLPVATSTEADAESAPSANSSSAVLERFCRVLAVLDGDICRSNQMPRPPGRRLHRCGRR